MEHVRGECLYCHRDVFLVDGLWVDPEAAGDDEIWREVCDRNDTFEARHEAGRTESNDG